MLVLYFPILLFSYFILNFVFCPPPLLFLRGWSWAWQKRNLNYEIYYSFKLKVPLSPLWLICPIIRFYECQNSCQFWSLLTYCFWWPMTKKSAGQLLTSDDNLFYNTWENIITGYYFTVECNLECNGINRIQRYDKIWTDQPFCFKVKLYLWEYIYKVH